MHDWKRDDPRRDAPSTIKIPLDLSALLVASQEDQGLATRADMLRVALENHLASCGVEPQALLTKRGFSGTYHSLMLERGGYQPVRIFESEGGEG